MSDQLAEALDRDTRAMERLATAHERIANTLEKFYAEMYPAKREPRDVTLTALPDTTDRLKQDQGATEETTEEWLTEVGPREREFIEQSAKEREAIREARAYKKTIRARETKGKS